MANYPTSLDNGTSLPNPAGTNTQNNPDHGALHTSENAAIIALESKLGTGSSTPASNTLLLGTGSGTSAWSQATSAQLAASISDKTGTGSAVFATTPTLVTPKVDTINENTLNNGVTVGGVNLKAGAINTSNAVTTASIAANAVTTAKLATGSSFTPVTVMQNPYKFRVYRNAAQNTAAGTTKVLFDTKTYDTGTNFDVTTNNRFTAPVAGFYVFSATIQTISNTAMQLVLYKNGVLISGGVNASGSSVNQGSTVNDVLQLSATDYIEVFVTASSAVAIFVGSTSTYFSGYLMSAT